LEFIQASAKGTIDVLTQALDRARLQLADQGRRLASIKSHRITDPQQQANLQAMELEFEVMKKNFEELLVKKYTADLTAEMTNQAQGERMTEIQPANFPDTPDFPNIFSFVGCGLGGGLALGVGLSLWITLRRKFSGKVAGPSNGSKFGTHDGAVKHEAAEPAREAGLNNP
jgi:uncharacterized protein involved in exopolysaccharide biosynthesis